MRISDWSSDVCSSDLVFSKELRESRRGAMSVSADHTSAINPDEVRATKRDWAGLIVLAFAVLLIAVDGTVLDLALPFISADLEPSSTQLLWIKIGRANVRTPVTNAHIACRLLL